MAGFSRDLVYRRISTPLGKLNVAVSDRAILLVCFEPSFKREMSRLSRHRLPDKQASGSAKAGLRAADILAHTEQKLKDYFSGKLQALSDLPVEPLGTSFQKMIWEALRKIPPGRVLSYSDLAKLCANKSSARAVGNACGANPIALIIPCHRVIAKDGSLGGYSAGLAKKEFLLKLEGALD